MTLEEVTTRSGVRAFLSLPATLYRSDPAWIQPLDQDVEAVFDPRKNKAFQHGRCIRWIVRNEQREVVGRMAAFVNNKTANKGNEQPTGGIGFFDCINDPAVAFLLFDTSKKWLQQQGMEAMDGPINFGNRDKWWGLLVEGFDRPPNYQCNYNAPYYRQFFEAYGFQVYFYQLTFGRPVAGPITDRVGEKARLAAKDPNYSFRYLPKAEWHKLPEYIRSVYNRAWANRGEIPELTQAQARHIVKQMKPIMDEKLLWFAYYKEEPVAFFLSLPEVNQFFKHVHGNFNAWGKLVFLWHRWRKTCQKAFGVLFGVVPEHQACGVDGGLIEQFRIMAQESNDFGYTEYEMNWIGDFNPKMIRVVEQINARVVKRHATYRYLFDRSKPFKRMPIVN